MRHDRRELKKVLALVFVAVFLIASVSAGCDVPKISIMVPLFSAEPPDPSAPLFQKIEKFANVKLDINFVPAPNYNEKVNVAIAANELPMAITVLDIKAPTFVNGVRAGMFWDLTDHLKALPTLAKNYDPKLLINASTDGKNFVLPRARSMARITMIVRKDWLAKVGLNKPTTVDEFYNMLKAFATKDPDGNGKNDTTGLLLGISPLGNDPNGAGSIDHSSFEFLTCAFGGGNLWEEKDGKLSPTFMSEPYVKAMKFFKKLYDEKLINQDFASCSQNDPELLMDQGKGGVRFGMFSDASDRNDGLALTRIKMDPTFAGKSVAESKMTLLDTVYQIKSVNGSVRGPATPGFNGGFAFPKTSLKNEEALKTILNFFDKMDTPDGQAMIKWGIEGRHYTIVNGIAQISGDTPLVTKEVNCLWQLFLTNQAVDRSSLRGKSTPMNEKILPEQADNANNIVRDPTIPLISDTYTARGPSLDKIINDAKVKYIIGAIDDTGWQQAKDLWVKSGGQQVMQEYTAVWLRNKK